MKNIFEQLTDLLKKDGRLVSQDNILLKNQAHELARKNDPELIKLLLSDRTIKQHFFFEVEKTLIFDKEKFIRFISNKQFLPDSYTAFKNKIGLTIGNEYASENKEVVLVWPYKDCILEGGMTKEDQKRDEIFYNETLAPNDISRLLDPKVFTNFKRINKNGEHPLCHSREGKNPSFKRDKKGIIKDNLIIKGNNLLALASLKKEFAGKVKLIYIDPPYNTGNDGFKYNDSFNHSSWLVFMRNRLEIAKNLLSEDGVIFVQCDDNEQAYLKVLMDEVFGRENFVTTFVWQKKSSGSQHSKHILDFHEYITVFSKNLDILPEFKIQRTEKQKESFKLKDEHQKERGRYLLSPLKSWLDYRKTLIYPIECPDGTFVKTQWVCSAETFNNLKNEDRIVFNKTKNGDWTIYKKQYENDHGGEVKPPSLLIDVAQNMQGTKEIQELFGEKLFANPKPEKLSQLVIEMSTNENDLVLDFFAGSGTTLAVAHKMNRQYIGIEQMDYIHDLPESRLKKVIAGEQGGISKAVNWQGGGDFIYMELAEWNEKIVKRIRETETTEKLQEIWHELRDNTFLSWRVDLKIFDANAKDFADLSIDNQKKALIECLDKNNLYVNLSEIEDKEYEISSEDIKLNYDFYGEKEE